MAFNESDRCVFCTLALNEDKVLNILGWRFKQILLYVDIELVRGVYNRDCFIGWKFKSIVHLLTQIVS